MLNPPRVLIVIALVISAVFVVAVISTPSIGDRSKSQVNGGSSLPGGRDVGTSAGRRYPGNVFAPPEEKPNNQETEPGNSLSPQEPREPAPRDEVALPLWENIRGLITKQDSLPGAEEGSLLPLPSVGDEEFSMDPNGISDPLEYLTYFAEHSDETPFDYARFADLLTDERGILLLPVQLVDRMLAGDRSPKLIASLATFRDFISARRAFFKSIPVAGEGIALNKMMIAFDKLTADLIERALKVPRGELTTGELAEFSGQYQRTATRYHKQFTEDKLPSTIGYRRSFLRRLADVFGLRKLALAFTPSGGSISTLTPLGGPILPPSPIPCTCPPHGFEVIIGTPVPANVYATTDFLASPLFFPFKSIREGAFWLGLYEPKLVAPCNALPLCVQLVPMVIMAGTSE